jgi:hypothetical protein
VRRTQCAARDLTRSEAIIGKLMHHYNEERLHATLGNMTRRATVDSLIKFETSVPGE